MNNGNAFRTFTDEVGQYLAVYYHCAQKIDESPEGLFAEAAQFARPGLAEKVAAFGRRTDVHLKQFGWQEQKTPDGVRYKFVW